MKIRKALLLVALLVLGAFFIHIAAMHPTAEELSRAEALETLLREEYPGAGELAAPLTSSRALMRAAPSEAHRFSHLASGTKSFHFAWEVCA